MTQEGKARFDIQKIAIIGAGPAGIASLYELSRVTKEKSLFGEQDVSKHEQDKTLAFQELVAFERNSSVGGVWNKGAYGPNNKDPEIPRLDGAERDLSNPNNIYHSIDIDRDLEAKLQRSSLKRPVSVPIDDETSDTMKHQWRSSAAYTGLFTNVGNRYMMFSFNEKVGDELKKLDSKYENIPGFQAAEDVSDYLEETVKTNNLEKYIRFNTNVERIRKLANGKWEVIVSFVSTSGGVTYLNWYRELFDAVVLGNGKTVPIVPDIKNMQNFAEANEHKTQLKLAKSIGDTNFIKDAQKILFVGSSVSSIDLIQYAFPRDLEKPSVYISRRSPVSNLDWITLSSYSKGIINKPEVEEFLPDSNSVKFADGTVESDFDAIVICCGYHTYYPFVDKSFTQMHGENVFKFFRFTFSLADPTLALVGNTYASFFFNRVETQAAAIAGVWSNQKKLPSLHNQVQEYENTPKLCTGNIDLVFMRPLLELAVDGRPHPFTVNKEKSDHVCHAALGMTIIQKLFFRIRDGEVNALDVTSQKF